MSQRPIHERATDPTQYDNGEVLWSEEGHGLSPVRRLFLEALTPFIGDIAGKDVLDLGCGQGWLANELARRGADVVGIDPSAKNIASANEQFPEVIFEQSDLQSFGTQRKFDLITAAMVFEHFPDIEESFTRLRTLAKGTGSILVITGDFDKFTNSRHGYHVSTQELSPGKVATRTDYGERAGVIYDIFRTTDRFIDAATRAGFGMEDHVPISAPDWLLKEQPKYKVHNGEPLFHLLNFKPSN